MFGGANTLTDLTEADSQLPINFAFQITRNGVNVQANTRDATTTFAFRDDGSSVASITIAASTTGRVDSGALTDDVASGSLCTYLQDLSTGTTGTQDMGFQVEAHST